MTDQIECHDCHGTGAIDRVYIVGQPEFSKCPACHGEGWRDETTEEANDRAADAYSDMCESEPPISDRERYDAAWKQKQELRR